MACRWRCRPCVAERRFRDSRAGARRTCAGSFLAGSDLAQSMRRTAMILGNRKSAKSFTSAGTTGAPFLMPMDMRKNSILGIFSFPVPLPKVAISDNKYQEGMIAGIFTGSFFLQFSWYVVEWLSRRACLTGSVGTGRCIGQLSRMRPLAGRAAAYRNLPDRCVELPIFPRRWMQAPSCKLRSPGMRVVGRSRKATRGNRLAPLWRLPVFSPRVAGTVTNNKNTLPLSARSTRARGGRGGGHGAGLTDLGGAYFPPAYPCPGHGAESGNPCWREKNLTWRAAAAARLSVAHGSGQAPGTRSTCIENIPPDNQPLVRCLPFPLPASSGPATAREGPRISGSTTGRE